MRATSRPHLAHAPRCVGDVALTDFCRVARSKVSDWGKVVVAAGFWAFTAGLVGCTVVHVHAPTGAVETAYYPGVVVVKNASPVGSLAVDATGVGLMGWGGSFTLGYGDTRAVLNPPADFQVNFGASGMPIVVPPEPPAVLSASASASAKSQAVLSPQS